MANRINLNQYPWLDDYNPEKDYYRVLHKPGTSVQTRELNTVQSMFKAQVERFADNVFQRGSIVSGVNFQFYSPYPYIKINDLQINGDIADPSTYVGALIEDANTGLKAYVVNYADGYEASAPDLKTLYLKYINSGNTGNVSTFDPSSTLTVYEGEKTIWGVDVNVGGTGFSNSDQVIISSALVVNVASGTFANADSIVNPDTGATAYIERVEDRKSVV